LAQAPAAVAIAPSGPAVARQAPPPAPAALEFPVAPPAAALESPAPVLSTPSPQGAPASEDEASAARPAASFFEDLDSAEDAEGAVPAPAEAPEGPPSPTDFHAPGVYVPTAAAARLVWPADICTAPDAEEALQRVLGGNIDSRRPLHAQAERTLQSLSPLERAVLAGEPQPVDVAPIRKAAVMRLRVADALASAPAPGATVDAAALSSVLGEIDTLLSEVAGLAGGAPEELKEPLDAVRNALVREAIDFSEVAQRVAASAAVEGAPRPAPRLAQARLLSLSEGPEVAEPGRGRRVVMAVILVISVLGAAVYHGVHYYKRAQAHRATPGLPTGMTDMGVPPEIPRMIVPDSTERVLDPAEVNRFKAIEESKGNTVVDTGVGPLLVVPGPAPKDTASEGKKPGEGQ
jgi:hypothetical protein